MRVNLRVSFEEKDEAKSLGARWDPARKTWYIQDVEDLTPFMRWITPTRLMMAAECQRLMPRPATDCTQTQPIQAARGSQKKSKVQKAREKRKERHLQRLTAVRVDSKPGVSTPRTDPSLPDCGCTHVAPWEHCQHSETALEGAELAHIRSI